MRSEAAEIERRVLFRGWKIVVDAPKPFNYRPAAREFGQIGRLNFAARHQFPRKVDLQIGAGIRAFAVPDSPDSVIIQGRAGIAVTDAVAATNGVELGRAKRSRIEQIEVNAAFIGLRLHKNRLANTAGIAARERIFCTNNMLAKLLKREMKRGRITRRLPVNCPFYVGGRRRADLRSQKKLKIEARSLPVNFENAGLRAGQRIEVFGF